MESHARILHELEQSQKQNKGHLFDQPLKTNKVDFNMQTDALNENDKHLEMSLKMSSIRLGPNDIKNKIDFNDKTANQNGYELTEISIGDDSNFMENEVFFVNDLTGEIIGEDVFWSKM